MKVYSVTGKFTIPGTDKMTTFSAKVTATSIRNGSRSLAKILQNQFALRIPKGFIFPDDFAMMNFDWESKSLNAYIDSRMIHSI